MKNVFAKTLKLDKKTDNPPPGETKPPAEKPPEEKKVTAEDLGYGPQKPEPPVEKPPEKKEETPPEKKPDPPSKDPVAGYEKEPKEEVEKPPEKKEEPPKDPPSDLDKKLDTLGLEKASHNLIKKQLTDLGLQGEQADKYLAMQVELQKGAKQWTQTQKERAIQADKEQRSAWMKELRNDPAFGGENYQANLDRAGKILDEHFSAFKKELTDAGVMLRPSVMRGLASVADALYPDRQLVHGDPPASEKETPAEGKPNDPYAFYQ